MEKQAQRKRRIRASYGDRCTRIALHSNGHIHRLLSFHDYSPCESGGEPRWFVKLLTHRRYPAGLRPNSFTAAWMVKELLPRLTPGKWTEVVISGGQS